MIRQVTVWNGSRGIVLTDRANGIRLLKGATGLVAPPVVFESGDMPGIDGEVFYGAKLGARDISLPCMILARTRDEFRAKLAELDGMLAWTGLPGSGDNGAGDILQLQITENGRARHLDCLYVGGLEGDEDPDTGGLMWHRFVLKFRAFFPYWFDSEVKYRSFRQTTPKPFFPMLPITLTDGQGLGTVQLENPGTAPASVVFRAYGPFTQATFECEGASLSWTGDIAAGEQLYVDTNPSAQLVIAGAIGLPTLPQAWDGVHLDSTMWLLPPGKSSVTVSLQGATSTSWVEMWYQARYRSYS